MTLFLRRKKYRIKVLRRKRRRKIKVPLLIQLISQTYLLTSKRRPPSRISQ